METSNRQPNDRRSRRRVRGLEWFVIALLAVVELAAAGTRDTAGDSVDGIDLEDSFEGDDSLDGKGLASETP